MDFPSDREILQQLVKARHRFFDSIRLQIFHLEPIPKGRHLEAGQHSFVRHPSARDSTVVRGLVFDIATATICWSVFL